MMLNPFDPDRGKRFATRLILGALAGQTPEEFAEQELAIIEARMGHAIGDTPTSPTPQAQPQEV